MVKRSKIIITQQPETIEKQNIIDIKSVTIEHPKTSCKVSKINRQAKKVSQVGDAGRNLTSCLYSETAKTEFFHERKTTKNAKIMKQSHTSKHYASAYHVQFEIFLILKRTYKKVLQYSQRF